MEERVGSAADPYLGLVLDAQYRLDALLGLGAMARVYRARHVPMDRDVAIKVLRRELVVEQDAVGRFKREAQIAARLAHPNVVVVHAVGVVPPSGPGIGGEPYVALELLEGPSLEELLARQGGTLPVTRALHIVLSLCDAVGHAHAQGVVHRDIKPENIMLVRRGDDDDYVKVLDFGLAKTLDEQADVRTRAGAILGTPSYLSPEGAEGRAVSPASDCYAIATVLYRCLTGRTPFEATSAIAVLVQKTSEPAPDVRSFEACGELPAPIASLVMQNLERRPEARAADARALGRALVAAARAAGLEGEQIGLSTTLLGSTDVGGEVLARVQAAVRSAPAEAASGAISKARRIASRRAVPNARIVGNRLFLFIACFVLGAVAALGVARTLGIFASGGAE